MGDALASRGHRVRVVSLLWSRPEASLSPPQGVPLVTLLPDRVRSESWRGRLARAAGRAHLGDRAPSRLVGELDGQWHRFDRRTDSALRDYLRETDADVVVGTRTGLNLALAQLDTRAVRIAQEHVGLHRATPAQRDALRRRLPAVDAVVSLTQVDARRYRALLGASTPVLAVPNAVPLPPRVEGAVRAPVVAAAGRLARQKGFDLLIEAWRPLAVAHPGWSLRIHGRGPLEDDLRAQARVAGLDTRVGLPGFAADLAAEFRTASVFVLSSRFEGLPMVLLEAMACGLPVVAFDCPTGPRQVIRHGRSGLLVPPGSVPDLTEALRRVIVDTGLRERLARGALRRVEHYSVHRVAQRWERLFADLLG